MEDNNREDYYIFLSVLKGAFNHSGDDCIKGNTRSHPEHGSQALIRRQYSWVTPPGR